MLKKYIALATVRNEDAELGTRLDLEVTVEYARKTVAATVAKIPFFDPPRKRALLDSRGGSVPAKSTSPSGV